MLKGCKIVSYCKLTVRQKKLCTFDDIRHWEFEESFTIITNKFLEHLPWDAISDFTDCGSIWQLNTPFIELKNILNGVKFVYSFVT